MIPRFRSTDLELARRIEAAHVSSGLIYQQALLHVAGGTAIFGGLDSPFTQALGIGMNGPVTAAELDQVEAFFRERGSGVPIDLCTLADPSVFLLIQERGYTLHEVSNVLVRAACDVHSEHGVSAVGPNRLRDWVRTVLRGFMEGDDGAPEEMVESMMKTTPGFHAYFGGDSAGAAMDVQSGLSTFFGDATLPGARRHGMQRKLIRHRLGESFRMGCDLISASVLPGSSSHRNCEREGFELLYTRIKVIRA